MNRGILWMMQGDYATALQEFQKEPLEFLRLMGEAITYHHLGRHDDAVAALQTLISTTGESASFQIAAVYAQWGDADDAMSWLERGYIIRDPGLAYLYGNYIFDPLKDDPRFQAFVRKMKFMDEAL